jgi:hypothetical protein
MNPLDFNDADNQRSGDLIPNGTMCKLIMSIRPGGEPSSGGWLTPSKDTDALYINAEFTVSDGPFARRKLWQNLVMSGGKVNDKGESIAANISRATLRAILESARGILPTDMSEAAQAKRRVRGFEEFDGMEFVAKIGVEKGKDGYQDKNRIAAVTTPDKKEYQQVMSGVYAPAPAAAPAGGTSAPAWAGGGSGAPAAVAPQNQAPKSPVPAWAQ